MWQIWTRPRPGSSQEPHPHHPSRAITPIPTGPGTFLARRAQGDPPQARFSAVMDLAQARGRSPSFAAFEADLLAALARAGAI